MKAIVRPSSLKGNITVPASKSSMQRALAAALLCGKKTTILSPGHSADDKAAINIIKALGCSIEEGNDSLTILSSGAAVSDTINCGESGLSIRMFTPIAALNPQKITINGEGSLLRRPLDLFDEVLPQLGVKVSSNEGKLPMTVEGPLAPRNIEVDGSVSSQYLTGLLMAFCAAGAKDVSILVKELKSKPYIDLTLSVIKDFDLGEIENRNYLEFYFHGPVEKKEAYRYEVEGDWSGASFLLVAGAIAGPITIRGLDLTSSQADKAILDALMLANAGIAIEAKGLKIHPASLTGFKFDATDCPDLFPPLVALAAYCKGETRIMGCHRLRHKESDRVQSLQEEFGKMGIRIQTEEDEMVIQGGKLQGAVVHSHHDHRIAMACAVAALKANGETTIADAEAVNKSYPDFFGDLEKLGADVSLDNKIKLHE